MDTLAVVILNWNGEAHLKNYLPGICDSLSDEGLSLYVADNASTDKSLEYVSTNHPQVKLLSFDKNYGFAEGYNKALSQIEAKYFCLLNSDVQVTKNWYKPAVSELENTTDIAACTIKLKDLKSKAYFEYAGAAGGAIDKYGYPFCRGRIFETLEKDTGQYDTDCDVFWGTGACLFVRAEDWRAAGGLDSDFFAHMEEIDLCWRLQNMGKRIRYVAESTVYHLGGGTLHKSNPFKTYLNFRNNLWLLHKNLPGGKLFPVFFVRFWLDMLAVLMFVFSFRFGDAAAIFRAWGHVWKTRKKTRSKRREMAGSTGKYPGNGFFRKSILWNYYVRGKKRYSQLDV